MAGLGVYQDFNTITGPIVLHGPTDFPNEAQEKTYLTEFWMNGKITLDGGKQIDAYVMKDDGSTASNNALGSVRTTFDPTVMAQLSDYWKLTEDAIQHNVIVQSLNEGSGDRFQQYVSSKTKEERRLATSYCNKFEADWFAQPNATTQQGNSSTTLDPYPFWLFLNEYGADGAIVDAQGFPSSAALPSGFTTIHNINPTTDKWYRPWQIPYSGTVDSTTVNPGGLTIIASLRKAITSMSFKPLPWKPGASTTNEAKYNSDYIVPVSTNGDAYIHSLATSNSNFFRTSPTDPFYPSLTFAGIPFVYTALMDRAAVYPTSGTTAPGVGAGVTESAADKAGPRFPFLSREHIKWFMHSKYNFYMWETRTPDRQWDVNISPISTLHNRMCTSRRKMAIVYPSADITGFGG